MRNASRFSLVLIVCALALFGLLSQPSVLVAEERFVDRGDGTVTDMSRKLMWQKGDNGREVSFEEAQQYCKMLRLGGYSDWRLPNPDERDTAVAVALIMPKHSRDAHAHLDLYWSSDRTVLIPFNYHPSQGERRFESILCAGRQPRLRESCPLIGETGRQ